MHQAREASVQASTAAQAVSTARDYKRKADSSPNNDNAEFFLSHYFRRIDPKVAESFTEEQRSAIKTMFSNRNVSTHHSLEVRRTLAFGRKRFYLIFLFGRERRAYERNGRTRTISQRLNVFFYLTVAAAWIAPGFLLAKLIG